jgi:hypothetical protein
MKIEFTESRELLELGRTVGAGDVLESSDTIPEELLWAYVDNGIAIDKTSEVLKTSEVYHIDSESTPGGE